MSVELLTAQEVTESLAKQAAEIEQAKLEKEKERIAKEIKRAMEDAIEKHRTCIRIEVYNISPEMMKILEEKGWRVFKKNPDDQVEPWSITNK